MPNKNYINGRAKEQRIVRQLKAEGWPLVIHSARSLGPVDVYAERKVTANIGGQQLSYTERKYIQSKPKSGYLDPEERRKKLRLEAELGIEIEVW